MNPNLDQNIFAEIVRPLRDLATAERLWLTVDHPRGTELMAQGATAAHVFVLEAGLVKLAYATPDGGERVKSFIVDQGVFGPAIGDDEGRYSAVTLEPSTVAPSRCAGWPSASARMPTSKPRSPDSTVGSADARRRASCRCCARARRNGTSPVAIAQRSLPARQHAVLENVAEHGAGVSVEWSPSENGLPNGLFCRKVDFEP